MSLNLLQPFEIETACVDKDFIPTVLKRIVQVKKQHLL